jgi:hypothetical protein
LKRGFIRQVQDARFLSAGSTLAGVQMAAMQLGEALRGDLPQPGIEGERPIAQIIRELAIGRCERLLNHIGGVHASGQPTVEPQGDHLAEALAVPRQELLASAAVSVANTVEELIGVGRERGHAAYLPGAEAGIRSL